MQRKNNSSCFHTRRVLAVAILVALFSFGQKSALAFESTSGSTLKFEKKIYEAAAEASESNRPDPKGGDMAPRGTIGEKVQIKCEHSGDSIEIEIERDQAGKIKLKSLREGLESLNCDGEQL